MSSVVLPAVLSIFSFPATLVAKARHSHIQTQTHDHARDTGHGMIR